ncbi:hypothetical protein ACSXC4_01805 [Clostridium perfringens]|mgnify:CR=1 FL=1|uniref:Uncharacterized protein n=4 Tax=Clostridium perfringens TaxID=1502 RepID=A0A127EGS3_CLOPF|nr:MULTISPECIES: hypothetical protein [Clostridium]AMN35155.1 hypothetical protein JFP838_05100 [Clostridium perfringens]EIF2086663.1 hypothetical protein [Clostridium perfringens]EIL8447041.1 hypothetical protein [Clostridium perfringens]ELC8385762.1 hypothetical protein [Clostridium perfringens]ELC8392669.1 hypothetical protein [Clostridium perfringens]
MDILSMVTAGVSIGTFGMIIVKFFWDSKQKKIDREISIMVAENRRKQQELFKNIIGILEVYRQVEYENLLKEESILFHEILNYKVGVWINLNYENKFKDDLRDNCNKLVTLVASALECNDTTKQINYINSDNKNRLEIWNLIDKYIEEEEKIIKSMLIGKK